MNAPEYDENQLDPQDFVTLKLEDELALASDPEALVERINIILASGQLSESTKTTIVETIAQFQGDSQSIVRSALFMVMLSPDYAIIK